MGLDMFVVAKNDSESKEIKYWRKHHDLHGYMQQLSAKRTGDDDANNFNGVEVKLTLADLDELETTIKNGSLPHTTGFFFGNNPPDEDSNKEDLEFIENARNHIKDGYSIYYDSSW